jgi:tetratricopeptide (TPR) repeat protein
MVDPGSTETGVLRECLRLARNGRAEAAEAECRSALDRFPDSLQLKIFLSRILIGRRDYERTYATLSPSLGEGFNRSDFCYNLGLALKGLGRLEEAAQWVHRAAELDPESWLPQAKLGQIQLMLFRPEEAEKSLTRAHLKNRSDVPTLVNLGHANVDLGNYATANRLLQQASETGQVPALVAQQRGSLAELLGDYDAATVHFQNAISADNRLTIARVGLAYSRKVIDPEDSNLRALLGLAEDPKLESIDRGLAHYAVAKSLEDLANYDGAMPHYDSANEAFLNHQAHIGKRFEADEYRARCQKLADFPSTTPREYLDAARSNSSKPVFVIGMIRSGTTLVEQMLGRHPAIAPGGELRFWTSIGAEILRGGVDRPEFLKEAVNDYLRLLETISPTDPRVVDKMPTNYHLLGLLLELFPNATFIHCKRNPIDTAISIYTTKYKGSPDFGHSRPNIAIGYSTYLELMKKFAVRHSCDRLTEVSYEALVQNPAAEMERLLSFIGVGWDPACLEPEKSKQPVTTPSSWQVRQPIYASSIRRSERFSGWLPDFKELEGL